MYIRFSDFLRVSEKMGLAAEWHQEEDARYYVAEAKQALEWLGFTVILDDGKYMDAGLYTLDYEDSVFFRGATTQSFLDRCLTIVQIADSLIYDEPVDPDHPLFSAGVQYYLVLLAPYGDDAAFDYHLNFVYHIIESIIELTK